MDKAAHNLLPSESFYSLNHEINNPKAGGKATPLNANYPACEMEEMPSGESYNVFRHYSKITNETYYGTYNSNKVHFISRLNSDGSCEIVYSGDCLKFSADPKAEITDWRVDLDINYICNKVPGGILKRLIWVDGTDTPIGCIDVQASIATDFFTTPFFDICPDDCAVTQLCVPHPHGCLKGEFVPFTSSDLGLSNHILDKGFKFMWRYVYYDGRVSEWSDRSSLYFQDDKGCFDSSEGFSRCIKFDLPIGNPMVDVIEFAFSEDGGVTWFIAERIEKYKKYNSNQQYWFQRELSENIAKTFNEEDCTFEYIFCNDKERIAIPPVQISREFNPMPDSAQALVRVKEQLGFYNYFKGYCPLDKTETEKFTIQLNCPVDADCKTEYATVKVRAIIHNTTHNRNQFIYRESSGAVDTPADVAKFGGLNPALDGGYEEPTPYDQTFDGKIRNFIAYIEGTDYWIEMKQWHSSNNWRDRSFHGIVVDMGNEKTRNRWRKDERHGSFFYQEAIFSVPRGTKGFIRLASHHAQGNEQDTSTFVLGTYNNLYNYVGDNSIGGNTNKQIEEIYFDTCYGDQDLSQAFVVQDNAVDKGLSNKASGYFGYVKDSDGRSVEGANVTPHLGSSDFPIAITDHNGFFHTYLDDGLNSDMELRIKVELDCGAFATAKTVTILSQSGSNNDIGIIRITHDDNATYTNGSISTVKVKVQDCDGLPVAGIRIALSGTKYTSTHSDGFATFKIRNYYTRNRIVKALIVDHNGCFSLNCNNQCNPCYSSPEAHAPVCFTSPAQSVITLSPITINKNSAITNRKGLKNGGRFPLAIMIEGDCGLISAAYPLSANSGYIDIPKAQEIGQVRFCDLIYNGHGIKLPANATVLKILRGVNINPFELQWVVDKIERTGDSKIKLTIQSLNDYNAKYQFKTNTIYQWIKNDRIEFIKNGDGKIFGTSTSGILNYLTISPFNDEVLSGIKSTDNANYFNQLLIEDNGKLDSLQVGAVIELQRPKEATVEPTYFEICSSIPLKQVVNDDGSVHTELVNSIGVFSTFDTYLVNRTIGNFPSQLFEHHSPSDFWGERVTDVGKPHFANKYENRRRYYRNITLVSPNQINYFGDFEKTFNCEQHGGLIAIVIKDDKVGLCISENDNSLFEVGDQLLRVGSDNIVRATTADALISNPEAKLIGEYGCKYEDIGSIYFGDGFATWSDSKNNAYIIHNYSFAKKAGEDISKDGQIISQCNSFFQKRIRDKENFNKSSNNFLDHYRYSTGQNRITNAVFLTLKSWRHSGINNASAIYNLPNDTIMYNPKNDNFLGFASFTPEGYSEINLNDENGCAFLTFQNSLPYVHMIEADKWNRFYGISCDWYVGVCVNSNNKIIIPQSAEIQATEMFYVKRVTTDKPNFLSEVPPIKVKSNQLNKWNFPILANVNSRSGLYGTENARGYFVKILLTRNNSLNLIYNSIDNSLRESYSELDSILVKYMVSEQSGFTENL